MRLWRHKIGSNKSQGIGIPYKPKDPSIKSNLSARLPPPGVTRLRRSFPNCVPITPSIWQDLDLNASIFTATSTASAARVHFLAEPAAFPTRHSRVGVVHRMSTRASSQRRRTGWHSAQRRVVDIDRAIAAHAATPLRCRHGQAGIIIWHAVLCVGARATAACGLRWWRSMTVPIGFVLEGAVRA
jgi:hypothetical protein